MLVSNSHPILAADFASTCIEKVCHHGALVKSLCVLLQSFHFDKKNSAVAQGVVVSVTMSFLHDHFVLEFGLRQPCRELIDDVTQAMDLLLTHDVAGDPARVLDILMPVEHLRHRMRLGA